jgi:hypothetical protein
MRRDAALTRTEVTLARVSAGVPDAERAARLAAVRDEIEAAP